MDSTNCKLLRLDNQLCFPLYAASREVIKLYKPYLDELDLTYTQYIAMLVLWERESVYAVISSACPVSMAEPNLESTLPVLTASNVCGSIPGVMRRRTRWVMPFSFA